MNGFVNPRPQLSGSPSQPSAEGRRHGPRRTRLGPFRIRLHGVKVWLSASRLARRLRERRAGLPSGVEEGHQICQVAAKVGEAVLAE